MTHTANASEKGYNKADLMKNSTQSHKEYERKWLSRALHKFQTAIGTFRFRNRSSDCNGALGNL